MHRLVVSVAAVAVSDSLTRHVLLAPRTSVPPLQLSLGQTRRAVHTTRGRLEDTNRTKSFSYRDLNRMRQDVLYHVVNAAPFLLLTYGIYFHYFGPPNRLRPSVLMNESFETVSQNPHVVSRLGTELFAYGDVDEFGDDVDHDRVVASTAVSDDRISHKEIEEKVRVMGPDSLSPSRKKRVTVYLEISYSIKGKDGQRAVVFARVRGKMTKDQYEYLIVEFVEDSSNLCDEGISHTTCTHKSGRKHLHIKYNIKGVGGEHAVVRAQVSDDMNKGEFVYLAVEFVKTGEVLEIVDNRQKLATKWSEQQPHVQELGSTR